MHLLSDWLFLRQPDRSVNWQCGVVLLVKFFVHNVVHNVVIQTENFGLDTVLAFKQTCNDTANHGYSLPVGSALC